MNTVSTLVLLASCFAISATSSIVYPESDLRKMDNVDACLFVCNICFDGKLMMRCVHDVCFGGKTNMFMGAVWIGHKCQKYDKIQSILPRIL